MCGEGELAGMPIICSASDIEYANEAMIGAGSAVRLQRGEVSE